MADSLGGAALSAADEAQAVAASVQRGFSSTLSAAQNLGQRVASTLSTAASGAQALGQSVIEQAVGVSGEIMTRAREVAMSLGQSVISGILALGSSLIGALERGAAIASTIATRAMAVVGTGASLASGAAGSVLGTATGVINGGGGPIGGLASGFVGTITGAIRGLFGQITGAVIYALGSVVNVVAGLAYSVVSTVTGTIKDILGAALEMALSGVSSTISSLMSSLVSAISAVILPVMAVVAGVVGNVLLAVGSKAATALAGALSWVGRTVTTLVTSLPALLAPIWGTITTVAGTVAGAIRSALGVAAGIARTAFTALAGFAQSAFQWASSLATRTFGFVAANIGLVISALTSLASTALSLGIGLAKVLGAGSLIAGFGVAIFGATQSALRFSANVKDLGARTGFSLGKSADILNRYSVQGVSAGAVQGAFGGSPFVANLKARAFGLPDMDSPGFQEALSRKFQAMNSGGPISQIMAQNMMRVTGHDSPELLRMAATPIPIQRQNAAFAQQINTNLGLDPVSLAKYANEIPALVTRIGFGFEQVALKLASVALPIVENVLGTVTKWVGANSSNIAGYIQQAVDFASTLPRIFAQGLVAVFDVTVSVISGLVKFASGIVEALPKVLGAGAQIIGNTLRGWGQGVLTFGTIAVNGLAGFLENTGTVISGFVKGTGDFIADSLSSLAGFLNGVWTGGGSSSPFASIIVGIAQFVDQVSAFGLSLTKTIATFGEALGNALVASPLGAVIAATQGITWQTPGTAATKAAQGITPTNLAAQAQRFLAGPTLPRWANNIQGLSDDYRARGATISNNLQTSMTNVANSVSTNGMAGVNAVSAGLNNAGGFFASPDGSHNVGRDLGEFGAGLSKPVVDMLKGIDQHLQTLNMTDAARAVRAYAEPDKTRPDDRSYFQRQADEAKKRYENTPEGRFAEALRKALEPQTQALVAELRKKGHVTGSAEAVREYMLKSVAVAMGRASNSYGGGGTG